MTRTRPGPEAATWYQAYPADEHGVVAVHEPHAPSTGTGNTWFVEGSERAMVVDTGSGTAPLRTFLESICDKPLVAFASVGYFDHAGALNQFDDRLAHPEERTRLRAPTRENTVAAWYMGTDNWPVPPFAGFDPRTYVMPATTPTREVIDGDIIDLGNRRFEVLHLPGVTAGCCGLYEAGTGILFTGEAFVWHAGYVYDGEPSSRSADADPGAFARSIDRLARLPVTAVYPGHGSRAAPDALKAAIADYRSGRSRASSSES